MGLCSVIIVASKGDELLFATIETVLAQKQLGELIIFDNGNAPDVVSRLQQYSLSEARIKVITMRGDANFAKCCNIAARQATSEYLVIFKSGYLISPDGLAELVQVLENENKAMLSSGFLVNYDGNIHNVFRNKIVTPKSTFFDIVSVQTGKSKSTFAEEAIAKNLPFEMATVPSACMCIRTSDYKRVAGLDEDFFTQGEEVDLSLRVQQVGGRVMCVPGVKITRLPGPNDNKISIARQAHEARNTVRYLNKFFSAHQPFGTLFLLNMLIMFHLFIKILGNGFVEFFQDIKPHYNNDAAKRLMILVLGIVDLPRNEELAKKIVLVTGADSQIGLCVIRRLIASGAGVLAIAGEHEIPYYHNNLRWMKKDLSDPNLNLDGYCADFVVHCAPLWQLPTMLPMLHNAEVKRVIAFGSTLVFSKSLAANDYEKDVVAKLQSAELLLAEKCAEFNITHTIFRPTQIYGVGLDCGISSIAGIIRRLGFMMVYPPAFGRRQPVHVDDLAAAVMQSIKNENSYNKSYNLSGGEVLIYREMLGKLFALYKKKTWVINSTALPFALDVIGKILRRKHINGEVARRMNDDLVFFHDDAANDFGYHPRTFLTGGMKDIEGF